MQAWCRVFRAALGQVITARALGRGPLLSECHPGTRSAKVTSVEAASFASSKMRGVATWATSYGFAAMQTRRVVASPSALLTASTAPGLGLRQPPMAQAGSVWNTLAGPVRWCQAGQLSRVRVPKGAAINEIIMPNTTQLKYGIYGIRAMSAKRVAANTIEAVRRAVRRKIKKTARLWVRIAATVPVTRKPVSLRMGKGKGVIDFYATAVRPGQIIMEMDRVPRKVALQALQAAQYKFPVKLGFVEWS